MKKPENVDAWWAKIVPSDSLRTKIILHIAQFGPSSAYDIAKKIYKPASRGYPSILRSIKDLKTDEIVRRVRSERSEKGGKKKLYSLTEYIGIPASWAYAGRSLDFSKLLEVHEP